VQILSAFWRQDAAVRRDVLQTMMLDAPVPSTIDAIIRTGCDFDD
jgi:hypothetical protein